MKDRFIEDVSCQKFKVELEKFIRGKWSSAHNATVELILADVSLFFNRYHRENGCFYGEK